jgi:uncharacterized surface protein with fasciclin (FAS1) repeats
LCKVLINHKPEYHEKIKFNVLVFSNVIFFAGRMWRGRKENTVSATLGKGQSAVEDNVSDPNVLQAAKSLDDFKTLVVAVEAAGVEDALVNAGPLTVFAPVNSAFGKLPEGTVETLLKPENKGQLAFILTNHVAPANYPIKQLKKEAAKGRKLYMASGKYLVVEDKEDGIYVGGTKVLKTVQVSNGWIHVIDNVLVPAE